MPIIVYEGTGLGTDAKRALAEKLTEAVHTALGYPREAITVIIHEAAAESIAIGGQLLSERSQQSAPTEGRTFSPSSRPSRPAGRPAGRPDRPSRPYERRTEGGRSGDRPSRPFERRSEGGRSDDRPAPRSDDRPARKWEPREGEAAPAPRKPAFRPNARPGGSRPGPGRPTSRPSKPGGQGRSGGPRGK